MAMVFDPKDPRTTPGKVVEGCGSILEFLSECFTWGKYGEGLELSSEAYYGLYVLTDGLSEVLEEASGMIMEKEEARGKTKIE